ncbi:MAG TPA: hypothetical protein VGU01_13730 [Sphingomicrobium sp.]|nr:hypothetical protein [Sphingomicrobium sp.]
MIDDTRLKHFGFISKTTEDAIERHFKIITFTLAGNVGAMLAVALAFKDYRGQHSPADLAVPFYWFVHGAISSVIALGITILTTEVVAFRLQRGIAGVESLEKLTSDLTRFSTWFVSFLIFVALYGYAAWCFFKGLYACIDLLH